MVLYITCITHPSFPFLGQGRDHADALGRVPDAQSLDGRALAPATALAQDPSQGIATDAPAVAPGRRGHHPGHAGGLDPGKLNLVIPNAIHHYLAHYVSIVTNEAKHLYKDCYAAQSKTSDFEETISIFRVTASIVCGSHVLSHLQ